MNKSVVQTFKLSEIMLPKEKLECLAKKNNNKRNIQKLTKSTFSLERTVY